jgi:hypothetical protein
MPENATIGAHVYQRRVSWDVGLFFDRQRDDEKPIGQVIAVGTWLYDNIVLKHVALIRIAAEFSDTRYRETPDGNLVFDPSLPIPRTSGGFVYRFLGTFGRGEYQSLDDAKRWAEHGPWGPVTWLT